MYYANDPRHEPEVRIDIIENQSTTTEYYYAHTRCYRKYFIRKVPLFSKRLSRRKTNQSFKVKQPEDP